MVSTSDFRNGLCLEHKNDLYTIIEFLHVKPGKGSAFVRTKLKGVKTGKVISETFPSGFKFKEARIVRHKYQYLYKDDMGHNFMNLETYEQIPIQEDIINNPNLLKEGLEVEILFHEETEMPLSCELPAFVKAEVTYTEPGMKGDTASGTTLKPATIDTGIEINVPIFINTGDVIKVDTRDTSYVERISK